jgi:hypothetical protein
MLLFLRAALAPCTVLGSLQQVKKTGIGQKLLA